MVQNKVKVNMQRSVKELERLVAIHARTRTAFRCLRACALTWALPGTAVTAHAHTAAPGSHAPPTALRAATAVRVYGAWHSMPRVAFAAYMVATVPQSKRACSTVRMQVAALEAELEALRSGQGLTSSSELAQLRATSACPTTTRPVPEYHTQFGSHSA
jgi:hypothetical protein